MAVDISQAKQATVTGLTGRQKVTIDGKLVIFGKNNLARSGQVISAQLGSGAEINFGSLGNGNLLGGSAIKIGDRCFALERGIITVNGKVPECLLKKIASNSE